MFTVLFLFLFSCWFIGPFKTETMEAKQLYLSHRINEAEVRLKIGSGWQSLMHLLPTSTNKHIKGRKFRKFPMQKTMTDSQPIARRGRDFL